MERTMPMEPHEQVPSVRFVVSLVGRITVSDETGADVTDGRDELIEEHLDQVMDELYNLGAADPSIDLSDDIVEFAVLVEAANPLGAVSIASGLLRTAIHAAKGATPDWPTSPDHGAWAVSLVSVRSDPVEHADGDRELAPA